MVDHQARQATFGRLVTPALTNISFSGARFCHDACCQAGYTLDCAKANELNLLSASRNHTTKQFRQKPTFC
jgi:hypothetical protein